jgi:hypothetical protein
MGQGVKVAPIEDESVREQRQAVELFSGLGCRMLSSSSSPANELVKWQDGRKRP